MNYFTTHVNFLLCAILCFAAAAGISAAEGELDPSFDGDGIVTTDNASTDESVFDLVVQPDGKIVAAGNSWVGSSWRTVIVRYNSNGSIDATFAAGGKIIIPAVFPEGLALQPNGKIVFAGSIGQSPSGDFYVARFNSDGSPDMTFNGSGSINLDLRGTYDRATSVKIQADGKIVVGGVSARPASGSDAALVRFNLEGSLDSSFDGDGKAFTAITPQNGFIADFAIQPDGKFVAAGTVSMADPQGKEPIETFAAFRFNQDGSLDSSFDGDGIVFTRFVSTGPFGSLPYNRVNSLALQSDGKVLVAGTAGSCCAPQPLSQIAMVRFNPDGSPDTSFGTGGKVLIQSSTGAQVGANDVAIQSDHKIVIAAAAGNIKNAYYAAARVNPDGSLDTTFSGDGWNIIFTQFGSTFSQAYTVAVQPDGKILTGGYVRINSTSNGDFMLARYDASSASRAKIADFDGDGKSDISLFHPPAGRWDLLRSATQDWLAVPFGNSADKITPADYDGDGKTDIAVFRDGVWYLLRSTAGFTGVQFGVAEDIPRPADFDGDGRAELAVFRPSNGAWYVLNLVSGQFSAVQFGAQGDKPVAADFDGDGKADYAVYRPADGTWYILRSTGGFTGFQFGISTDVPVPADYDGDGKTDPAVYRNGVWYLLLSTGGFTGFQFGVSSDIPSPADYDGDGRADPAVYRNGTWYLQQSSNGFAAAQFGQTGDKPVASAYIP